MKSWLANFFQRLADFFSPRLTVESSSGLRPVSYPKAESKDWTRPIGNLEPAEFERLCASRDLFNSNLTSAEVVQLRAWENEMRRHMMQRTGTIDCVMGAGGLIGGALGQSIPGVYRWGK